MNAVDTNVLVYAVDATEPVKSRQADELIRRLKSSSLVVPWQAAVEFMSCVRRWEDSKRIRPEDTDDYLDTYLLSLPIVQPSLGCLSAALALGKRYSLSYWDSLLIAACTEAGVTTLYSEDMASGMTYGTVTVINPF